ncbi:MAG: hypothetical protein ACP5MG_12390 [Verrucomicrobiia bacterium]|jgi:hypothetical protein
MRKVLLIAILHLVFWQIGSAQTDYVLIYRTGFEYEEGFDPQYTLVGQGGWEGEGSAWNGLVADENYFPGFGQQAYIGYSNSTPVTTASVVWRPLNYQILTNYPVIRFSVIFQIKDSTNRRYDDFRWSVYNMNTQRLFSLDFDNETLQVNYSLDTAGEFYFTGYTFSNDGVYELQVAMNFARNRWIATLNDTLITPEPLPITTRGYALNLGDIDAGWVLHNPQQPGDNYMVFDEFTVLAQSVVYPPRLIALKPTNQIHSIQLIGEPAVKYFLDVSTNLSNWINSYTNTAPPSGFITFTNSVTTNSFQLFYRARM